MHDIVAKMRTHTMKVSSSKEIVVHKKIAVQKNRKYMCPSCQYESDRHFNVIRHEMRIHCARRPRICCDQTFLTKGEYYLHCEEVHPQKREHTVTSKLKYKICCNYVAKPCPTPTSTKYGLRKRRTADSDNNTHVELRARFRFKYSINYSEFHLEKIPLIYFLTDNGLRRYLKTGLDTSPKIDKSDINHSDNSVEINNSHYIKSEKVEQCEGSDKYNSVSEFQTENLNDRLESPIPFELPVKKLILRRFTATTNIEFENVVITQKGSVTSGAVLTENSIQKSKTVSTTFVAEKRKQTNVKFVRPWLDKENQPRLHDVADRYVAIQLDSSIISPITTQQHREYLDSINFESYKIF